MFHRTRVGGFVCSRLPSLASVGLSPLIRAAPSRLLAIRYWCATIFSNSCIRHATAVQQKACMQATCTSWAERQLTGYAGQTPRVALSLVGDCMSNN